MPSFLPTGLQTSLFGQDHALANHSPEPDAVLVSTTKDIFGPRGATSSPSAALQYSLENKLRARLGESGSPLYVLTWKRWATPSGVPISALRGRVRRICASDCFSELSKPQTLTGWPTPDAGGWNEADRNWQERRAKLAKKHGNNGFGLTLGQAVQLSGWTPPICRDHKDGKIHLPTPINGQLGRQVWLAGSSAPMGSVGRLNPAHTRYLMGYQPEWCVSAVTAMQSFRR